MILLVRSRCGLHGIATPPAFFALRDLYKQHTEVMEPCVELKSLAKEQLKTLTVTCESPGSVPSLDPGSATKAWLISFTFRPSRCKSTSEAAHPNTIRTLARVF